MTRNKKVFGAALAIFLFSSFAFATAPSLTSAQYSQNDNQLTLGFDQAVKLDAVLMGLISFDDDNGGPSADLQLQGGRVINPSNLTSSNQVVIDLVYGGVIDQFTGDFFGVAGHVFELWGNDVQQIKSLEAMNTSNLMVVLDAGAFVSSINEANEEQALACVVTTADQKPTILYAEYDANVNSMKFVFDSAVQFDVIAEDRSENGGPGNGLLQAPISGNDPGEDRNDNGVLDFETNIRPFEIGLVSADGSMALENIGQVFQTVDDDTIDIELTGNDAKRLESTIGYSGLHLAVNEWAFVDTMYNPNNASDINVTVIPDSVNFVADSASYDRSKNILSIYFSNLMTAGRTITLTNPSPVYTKMHIISSAGTYTINGVEGNPSAIAGFNNSAFKFKLPIPDQAGAEALLDGSPVTLSMNSFALYDNLNNGNAEFEDVPVRILSSTSGNEQPPVLISSSYDFDSHTLTLTWDLALGVGFYKGTALTTYDDADYQELTGFNLFDTVADTAVAVGEGMVYYSGSKKNTYIELAQSDAIRLETHANINSLHTHIDESIFNAFLFLNGNSTIGSTEAIPCDIIADTTAPALESVRFNVFTKTLELDVDEPVSFADLATSSFNLAGVGIDGTILNDAGDMYASSLKIEVSDATYNSLEALPDSVFSAPDLYSNASALTNISGLHSSADTLKTSIGRTFYLRSFEAFAPSPTLRFGALKLIGTDADIYVDDEMWAAGKVNEANLLELQTAFESSTPIDSTRGIKEIVDAYYGGILDTDGNGKLIIFLADLLDEYDQGRNDTDDSFFENGFATLSDTTDGQYSNQSDMIYLDVNPQVIGEAPYTEWDESMFNALTYQYSLLSAISQRPDQERWVNYGMALKMQEQTVGDIKFFGEGSSAQTVATASNELTYIAGSLLKSRYDLFNVYNYFTYLTEKYSSTGDSLAILREIAQSDLVGIETIDEALTNLSIDADAATTFQNYAVACFLDLTQYHADANPANIDSAKYGGLYNFAALELDGAPGGKNAGNLSWDKASGSGAPFSKSSIYPWSFNFYVARAYFLNIDGDFVIVSPDLNSTDTLVFDGYDGINFKATKILLHSGYLEAMTQDFEAVDFELDPVTSRGQLPMTTDPYFEFRSTVPDTAHGVQLLAMVVSKTDYAQPPVTYDYVVTNVTSKPDFGDFYAVQNPDVENFLDLFVVSERPIYGLTGEEGASVTVYGSLDTVIVEMPLHDASDGVVSVYSGKYTLQEVGDYSLVFSGRDQNGVALDPVTRNIGVGLAKPTSRLSMTLPDGMGQFVIPTEAVTHSRFVVASTFEQNLSSRMLEVNSLPPGIRAVSNIIQIGHDKIELNRAATLQFALAAAELNGNENLGIYTLRDGEWSYLGGRVDAAGLNISANTGSLGRFVIADGDHPAESTILPTVFALEQNYPNPFNPSTTISFALPRDMKIDVRVYNMLGQEIATLADGFYTAGHHEVQWNARDASQVRVASGVYFYTVESADTRLVKKMVLLK